MAPVLLAGLAGCGGLVDDPIDNKRSQELDYYNGCIGLSATNGWVNTGLGEQVNKFSIEFDVIPSSASMNALFGLSNGWADAATDLAASVRMSPTGVFEARNAGVYTALNPLRYTSGQRHRTRFDVDLLARRYSVAIAPPRSTIPVEIARNFSFGSEQATLGRLDTLAQTVASSSGAFSVCGLRVTPNSDCLAAAAGAGWVVTRFDAQMALFTISFEATPSAAPIDAPIGLQASDSTGFTELAAAVRFGPSGIIDVRDGSQYRADVPVHYEPNRPYRFEMRVDVMARRYSVWAQVGPEPLGAYTLIAADYAFRSEQSNVISLSRLARTVASATGAVEVCNVATQVTTGNLQYLKHLDAQDVAATPTGNLVVSNATRSVLLDPDGNVLAQAPVGGRVAVDNRGYITLAGTFSGQTRVGGPYLVSAGGTDIYVAQFNANWQHRWSRRFGTPGDDTLGGIAAGNGVVATSDTAGTLRLNTDGTVRWHNSLGGADVAMDYGGNVFLVKNFSRSITVGSTTHDVGEDSGILLARFDNPGIATMSRAFTAVPAPGDEFGLEHEHVQHVSFGGNDILISGTFLGLLDLAGVQLIRTGQMTGHFVARFNQDGAGISAQPISYDVQEIAGDAFGNLGVTGYDPWTGVLSLDVYDWQGTHKLGASPPFLPHADPTYVNTGQGFGYALAFDRLDYRRAVYSVGWMNYGVQPQGATRSLPFVVKYPL